MKYYIYRTSDVRKLLEDEYNMAAELLGHTDVKYYAWPSETAVDTSNLQREGVWILLRPLDGIVYDILLVRGRYNTDELCAEVEVTPLIRGGVVTLTKEKEE